jgi:hypothetical protein
MRADSSSEDAEAAALREHGLREKQEFYHFDGFNLVMDDELAQSMGRGGGGGGGGGGSSTSTKEPCRFEGFVMVCPEEEPEEASDDESGDGAAKAAETPQSEASGAASGGASQDAGAGRGADESKGAP